MERWNLVKKLKDDTTVYRNPFTGTESWTIPERKHRPFYAKIVPPDELQPRLPENYCAFCAANYIKTTPEKTRIELLDGQWILIDAPDPEHIFSKTAEFRRIGNLYEIFSTSYWTCNYGYQLSAENRKRASDYLANPKGREHINSLLSATVHHAGVQNPIDAARVIDAFFGGAHELIIPRRHYIEDARQTNQLCSTGVLTPEEHLHYLRLTCFAAEDIYAHNSFLTFIGVYTNWRHDAGATFEHLHRQVIGLDRYGYALKNGISMAAQDAGVYQDYVAYVALQQNLFLCENEHAIAFADIGHPFATVAIYSKSPQPLPWAHTPAELRGMSDVIHAVHAAFGAEEAVNEEWYYQPRDTTIRIPWHV
ncbi:DUF4921 family protein, partial [candidate division KSB1 bacterium]